MKRYVEVSVFVFCNILNPHRCLASSPSMRVIVSVAPVAYQATLGPGIGLFREFEPPPSAYWYKFVGGFSWAQIDSRKARERELATLDERNRRAVGLLNPMRDKKMKARTGGEMGRHL